ncbi:Transcriptional regulatory protein SEF1 [Pleurostoma richardsiae]|uniref:Transcriptional regulatory protein SEF1 n=1 Tax=Pleurostoma richardsiae TaxID=41990 RepID=A0AA38S1J2_9PEZI|nr:Transcriptional regulatory protein SEF1 [Pleurostoma richardsiae]
MSDGTPAPAPNAEASPSPHRIKRNTACVNCRDSKVKCNASLTPGLPCLRCTKLQLQCVVDKSHKRVSRRSKLEELVQEVQSIKEAVGSKTPVAPQVSLPQLLVPPLRETPSLASATSFQIPSIRPLNSAPPPEPRALTPALTAQTTPSSSGKVSEPRALKSRVFPGQDIDYYFDKYFDHFHPYLPIVRVRDPDACYKAGPLLFWTIIVTASRRYARDDSVFPFLVDSLQSEIWGSLSEPPISLSTINALLLLCAWPLSTIRLMRDPSLIYAGICMNACFLIGLHTGQGDHPEFSYPSYPLCVSHEEAIYTWAGYNIMSQGISSYCGIPPMGQLFNRTIDSLLDRTCTIQIPNYFAVQLEAARFSNRVSRTMAAVLEGSSGVSHHIVSLLEEDLDKIQCLLSNDVAEDLNFFFMLFARLDIQVYYFLPPEGFSPDILKRNVLKCFNTAQALIQQALKLDQQHFLMRHAPHYVYRSVLTAACVLMAVFLSPWMSEFGVGDAQAMMSEAISAMNAFSIQEGDLPIRVSKMMEQAWMARHLLPPRDISRIGFTNFKHRLVRPAQTTPIPGASATQPPLDPSADPSLSAAAFPQIDWNVFMEDFDWSFDPELLTVPT